MSEQGFTETTTAYRYYRDGETVQVEETVIAHHPDGTTSMIVGNVMPPDAQRATKGDYQLYLDAHERTAKLRQAEAEASLIKMRADKQAAIARLTEMGLTPEQARALSS